MSAATIAAFPASGTQPARLLSWLLLGRQIEPLAAWLRLGIYRLADTVFQLRGLGWPVSTERLDVKNRFQEACHVALYRLPNEAITSTGSIGQEFAKREFERLATKGGRCGE